MKKHGVIIHEKRKKNTLGLLKVVCVYVREKQRLFRSYARYSVDFDNNNLERLRTEIFSFGILSRRWSRRCWTLFEVERE